MSNKTHCKRGHERIPSNKLKNGQCRPCQQVVWRTRQHNGHHVDDWCPLCEEPLTNAAALVTHMKAKHGRIIAETELIAADTARQQRAAQIEQEELELLSPLPTQITGGWKKAVGTFRYGKAVA